MSYLGAHGWQSLRSFSVPRYVLLVAILFSSGVSRSQLSSSPAKTERPVTVGASGLYGPNFSSMHMEEFAGQEFCGTFSQGSAPGLSLGLNGELPMGRSEFSIVTGLYYRDQSSQFKTEPFTLEHAFDVTTGEPVPISRERVYSTKVSTLTFAPGASWRPLPLLRFDIEAGVGFILSHSYTKEEHLLTPGAVYTQNNLSTLPLENGTFQANKVMLSLESGIGYDLALSNTTTFTPALRASFPITPIATSGGSSYRTWSIAFGAGISVKLLGSEAAPIPPPPAVIPTDKPVAIKELEKSVLRVEVKAVGISESGEEVPEPVVSIQNVRVTDISPTLGYVFFDDGSKDIPDRYNRFSEQRDVKGYQTNSFFKLDALGLHYEVLNIIGKRLQEEPDAKIVLTGTRSIRSPGDSASEDNIALSRAQSVSKYLQDVWAISPSRIKIKSRGLPDQASDDNTATGSAENRRVEISSPNQKLLDPIETKRIERTASPPRIAFDPYITSSAGVRSMNITIRQGEKVLEQINGLTGESTKEWFWNIPSESVVAGTGDTVTWEMNILDSAGNSADVNGKIAIRREEKTLDVMRRDTVIDKSLERFQLLLFDYSKTSTSHDYNVNSLLNRVAATITPESRISLVGYTDVTGDPAFNDRLSLDRASKASILLSGKLRQGGIRTPQFSIEGRGSREVLYDNTYPEGRFLSRTVRISIEKDLK